MIPDPIEQAAIDEAKYRAFNEQTAWWELRKRLVEREDWRKSKAITDIQGQAVADAIVAHGDIHSESITTIAKIASEAILKENLKHVHDIEAALTEMRKWALTDEELAELMS